MRQHIQKTVTFYENVSTYKALRLQFAHLYRADEKYGLRERIALIEEIIKAHQKVINDPIFLLETKKEDLKIPTAEVLAKDLQRISDRYLQNKNVYKNLQEKIQKNFREAEIEKNIIKYEDISYDAMEKTIVESQKQKLGQKEKLKLVVKNGVLVDQTGRQYDLAKW